jgi:non-specific serine/threonine protein kinase/serine/threonine-protein kinase
MASQPSHGAVRREDADRFLGTLLDAPAAARRPMMDALRVDDPELFALVDSLFVHFEEVDDSDGFLATPFVAPPVDADEGEDVAGLRFGHWQVVKPLGRGGMGLVFEVERADGVVRQRAALKLIKRSFHNRSVVARFHTERQILAQLDHPSIARLIDAGTADDRPYLVMEYVDGVPLDRWCDGHALSIEARLALFNRICAAVHYAHQRLVVHRDLKPGNILVTADGTPKLLDFGISKLVGADGASAASAETIDASALLTPRYASPEQLGGAPISTTSDVYALGVLLFELLTGVGPYRTRNDSLMETMRVVLHETPMRASFAALLDTGSTSAPKNADDAQRLARRLRGDLDHIVQKALAREPADRYASVAALRDDLVRHLAGDPIEATESTWRYRAGKFVRRHRAAVAATAVTATVIVGLGLFAAWQAYRAEAALVVAEAQRAAAERRFEDTRSLAKTMLFELDGAIASGPTKAREQLVRTAVTYLDRLSQDRLSDDLQREVAAGYEHIADILGSDITKNLGRSTEAQDYLAKALKLREHLVAVDPDNPVDLAGLVDCNMSLATLARRESRIEKASVYLDAALAAATRRVRLHPGDLDSALKVFPVRRMQAIVQYYPEVPSLNHYDEAVQRFRGLIDDVETFGRLHPEVPRATIDRYLNSYLHDYAQVTEQGGQLRIALAAAQRSLQLSEASARARPDDPIERRKLMLASDTAGVLLIEVGDSRQGMALLERSTVMRGKLAAADPESATAAFELTEGFARMGAAYEAVGRPREALAQYASWVLHAEQAKTRNAFPLHDPLDLAAARTALARMRLFLGDPVHALEEARRAERDVLAFDANAAANPMAHQALGEARLVIARASQRPVDKVASFALAQEALQSLAANTVTTPADAVAARILHRARIEAGLIGYDEPSLQAAGCSLIETGRDGLARLKEQDRLVVSYFPVIDQASRALRRCS